MASSHAATVDEEEDEQYMTPRPAEHVPRLFESLIDDSCGSSAPTDSVVESAMSGSSHSASHVLWLRSNCGSAMGAESPQGPQQRAPLPVEAARDYSVGSMLHASAAAAVPPGAEASPPLGGPVADEAHTGGDKAQLYEYKAGDAPSSVAHRRLFTRGALEPASRLFDAQFDRRPHSAYGDVQPAGQRAAVVKSANAALSTGANRHTPARIDDYRSASSSQRFQMALRMFQSGGDGDSAGGQPQHSRPALTVLGSGGDDKDDISAGPLSARIKPVLTSTPIFRSPLSAFAVHTADGGDGSPMHTVHGPANKQRSRHARRRATTPPNSPDTTDVDKPSVEY